MSLDAVRRKHFEVIAFVVCATAFVSVAIPGLQTGLFPDDLMNLYGAWTNPASKLALDIAGPSKDAYRPVGALALKISFEIFGLNAFPYRLLCISLLGLNVVLHFLFVRAVSRSVVVACLSVCLFTAHAFMSDLYLSTATIYDLLAFAFVHAGMLIYIEPRAKRDGVSWKRWAALVACIFLAAGSKEVGLALPVMLVAYEALFHDRATRRVAGPVLLTILAAAVVLLPLLKLNGMTHANPAYALKIEGSWISNMAVMYIRMLLLDTGLRAAAVWAVLGSVALMALVWRQAEFRFGALLFALAAAPLLLIEPRSLYVLYIAYSGWCLLWAVLLSRVPLPPVITLLAVAAVFGSMNLRAWAHTVSWAPPEQAKVWCAAESVKPLLPSIKPGTRVLITDDPFPPDDAILIFAFRLLTRDKDLQVWRLRAFPQALDWPEPWSMKVRMRGCRFVRE